MTYLHYLREKVRVCNGEIRCLPRPKQALGPKVTYLQTCLTGIVMNESLLF